MSPVDVYGLYGGAVELLKKLREQGLPLDQALDRMKEANFGSAAVVMKAVSVVEGIGMEEARLIMEQRKDLDDFDT